MNERIKELMEKATINIGDEDHGPIEFFHKEKFAELIIKECAALAAITACPYEDEALINAHGHTWDMACAAAARNIRDSLK